MQPCSREMQAMNMNSLLNQQQQQQQSHMSFHDLQNGHHHQPPHHFDSPAASSHDDFLEQILSSTSWPPPLHPDISAAAASKPQSPWDALGSLEDQSALLASKLRQHQIGGANKAMMLQQQLLLSRGLAAGNGLRFPPSGLLSMPLSLSDNGDQNDVIVNGLSFKSANSVRFFFWEIVTNQT